MIISRIGACLHKSIVRLGVSHPPSTTTAIATTATHHHQLTGTTYTICRSIRTFTHPYDCFDKRKTQHYHHATVVCVPLEWTYIRQQQRFFSRNYLLQQNDSTTGGTTTGGGEGGGGTTAAAGGEKEEQQQQQQKEEKPKEKEDEKDVRIRDLQQYVAELRNNFMIARADMENTRKQLQKDIDKAKDLSIEKLVKQLFPMMDTINFSVANKPAIEQDNIEAQIAFDALETTKKQVLSIFRDSCGVEEYIPALGDSFDPVRHHALFEVDPPESHPNLSGGTVGVSVKSGWKRHNTLLRPASVGVVKHQASTSNLPPLAKQHLEKMREAEKLNKTSQSNEDDLDDQEWDQDDDQPDEHPKQPPPQQHKTSTKNHEHKHNNKEHDNNNKEHNHKEHTHKEHAHK